MEEIKFPKVKLRTEDNSLYYRVWVNDKEINTIRKININKSTGEYCLVKMEFLAEIE